MMMITLNVLAQRHSGQPGGPEAVLLPKGHVFDMRRSHPSRQRVLELLTQLIASHAR